MLAGSSYEHWRLLPVRERVDETTHDGTKSWADERSSSEDGHWDQELLRDEHVDDSSGSDTEECASGKTTQETRYQESLDVLGDGARNQPDEEEKG